MRKRLKRVLRAGLALAVLGALVAGGHAAWRALRAPEAGGAIRGVKARVEVGRESATVRLAFEIAGPGLLREARVPLLPAGVALLEARLDGREAEPELAGDRIALVVSGAGVRTVEIAYVVPLGPEPGGHAVRRLALALPRVVSTAVEVSLAEPDMLVHVPPPAVVRMLPAKGRTEARVITPPTDGLEIAWLPKPREVARAVRLAARTETLYTLQGGSLSGRTEYGLRVDGPDVSRLEFTLPGGVAVDEVETGEAWLKGWEVAGGKLVVQAYGPVPPRASLAVCHRRPLAGGEADLAVPLLEGAVRQWGYGAVAAGGAVELKALSVENGRPIDPRGLPASLRQAGAAPVARAFRYDGLPSKATLSVVRHEESETLEATADSLNALLAYTPDGRCVGKAVWWIRNVRRQHLGMRLPEGAELWSVYVDGNPVRPARDEAGRTLVPLSCSAATASRAFAVEVVYYTQDDAFAEKGEFSAALPEIDVPVMLVMASLSVPEEIHLEDFTGDLRPVESFAFSLSPQDVQLVREAKRDNPADPEVARVNEQLDEHLRREARGQVRLRLEFDALTRNDAFQRALRWNGDNNAFVQQYYLENWSQEAAAAASAPAAKPGEVSKPAEASPPGERLNLTGFGQEELARITGLASLRIPVPLGGPVRRFERQLVRGESAQVRAAYWSSLAARPKADAEPRLVSEVAALYRFSPRALALEAALAYRLEAGKVAALRYELPAGARVLSVRGANVARWEQAAGALAVHLVRPERAAGRLVLAAEFAADGEAHALAPPRLAGASSERALLAVAAPSDYELRFPGAGRLEPAGVAELPAELLDGHRSVSVFRLGGALAREVKVEAVRRARLGALRATCDSVNAISFYTDEGVCVTRAIYEIRNVAQRHLALALPEGAEIWGAFVADRAVRPLAGEEGKVLLPLELSRDGRVRSYPVEVVYVLPGAPFERRGKLASRLPEADVPVMHAMYSVYVPQRLRVWGFAGSLRQVREFSEPATAPVPGAGKAQASAAPRGRFYNDRQAALEWNVSQRDVRRFLGRAEAPGPGAASPEAEPAACGLKVYIPAVGRLLRFERHLVVKGEMSAEFTYRG